MMVASISQGVLDPCLKIVSEGFDINEVIIDCGITILMHVCSTESCNADSVKQILSLNPDVNKRDTIGRSALHFACRAGKIDAFQALVENEDVDVDAVTNSGVTPLMTAVESGNI